MAPVSCLTELLMIINYSPDMVQHCEYNSDADGGVELQLQRRKTNADPPNKKYQAVELY